MAADAAIGLTRLAPCAVILAALVGGCLSSDTTTPPRPSPASVSPSTAAATSGATDAEPGRPYAVAEVLEAMAGSRRPDGVPDEIETPEVASAAAEQLWTYSGEPWEEIVASGSCGPESCTLELSGTPAEAVADDVYVFNVSLATGRVTLADAVLRGLPDAIIGTLDALARNLAETGDLGLVAARWRLPPEFGTFDLAYRSGGEELSCGVDLVIDAQAREVVERQTVGC